MFSLLQQVSHFFRRGDSGTRRHRHTVNFRPQLLLLEGRLCPAVDLQGYWVVPPTDARWGQVIGIESQVRNTESTASGSFQIEWYISRDRFVSSDDIRLYHTSGVAAYNHAGVTGNNLGPYFTALRQLPSALPSGWSGSNFYVVMKTDSAGQVAESREDNNSGQVGNSYDYAPITVTSSGAAGDQYEPDDTVAGAAVISTNGTAQTHSIHAGYDVDWVKFTLTATRNVTIQTDGVSGGDTEIQLYRASNGSVVQIPGGYDDDDGSALYSKLVTADTGALTAGTYYVRVKDYGSDSAISTYTIRVTASQSWARTHTGWYFPLQYPRVTSYGGAQWPDGNFGFWGSSQYYAGLRHIGTDMLVSAGTSVMTIGPGTVIARSTSGWGTGNVALAIRHTSTSGDFVAVYGHIRSNLQVGSQIQWGQVIGTIGAYPEGGDHLHFGIRPGSTISGSWGRISDPDGSHPGETNGFVPPISWINTETPVG
jgi:hypothetical protein